MNDHIDAARIESWIFDLDNTLYPASLNLFAQVDQRIGEFIARHFNIPFSEARQRQKAYFRTYGTTLRGLMTEHDIDPIAFMEDVHAVDITALTPSPELNLALDRLPGRKFIYTNGSADHARRITDRLGITSNFTGVFDIIEAQYVPKPDPRPYHRLIEAFGIDPKTACMVEDLPRNLAPAAALGMTTVWVRTDEDWAQPEGEATGGATHIDYVTDNLLQWLAGLTVRAD